MPESQDAGTTEPPILPSGEESANFSSAVCGGVSVLILWKKTVTPNVAVKINSTKKLATSPDRLRQDTGQKRRMKANFLNTVGTIQ
jgi:hypothetical protein